MVSWVKLTEKWVVPYSQGVLSLENSRGEMCFYARDVPVEHQHATSEAARCAPALPVVPQNTYWTVRRQGSWYAERFTAGTFVYGEAPDYQTRYFGDHDFFCDPRALETLRSLAQVSGWFQLDGGDDHSDGVPGSELFATEAEAQLLADCKNGA